MRLHSLVGLLGLAAKGVSASSGASFIQSQDADSAPGPAEVIPGQYILEFAQDVNTEDAVREVNAKPGISVYKVYDSDVFHGVAVQTVPTGTVESDLEAIQPVSSVWPSRRIRLPVMPSNATGPLGRRAEHAEAVSLEYAHSATGVDKLHAAGILGTGAIVGVVDTGVNYNHPALGGGIGPGKKVAKGYDFVGSIWPSGPKEPDGDPDDEAGHGTHVAGIVAGSTTNFAGVAPNATIYAYKVFSGQDYTDEATLIEAFLMAYNDGVDVITCSIGAYSGWADGPWQVVADRIVDGGVVITVAVGNSGDYGPFLQSSGSSAKNVIGVASTEGVALLGSPVNLEFKEANGSTKKIKAGYLTDEPIPSSARNLPFVVIFDGADLSNACGTLPSGTPSNLAGKVVLVKSNGCMQLQKQKTLEARGAKYILHYDDTVQMTIPYGYGGGSEIGAVTADTGLAIVRTIRGGGSVTASFIDVPFFPQAKDLVWMANTFAGTPSSFSSYGALWDLSIKPDIAAPGANVYSTYLDPIDWTNLSGTSMATPYVAGIAALYISKFGGRRTHGPQFAKFLTMKIISSGKSIPWMDGGKRSTEFNDSVAHVGTGLVDATKVLDYTTALSLTKFALNDTRHFQGTQKVDITNSGKTPLTYTFGLDPGAGFEALANPPKDVYPSPRIKMQNELTPVHLIPGVVFPAQPFAVGPGETRTATFVFTPPPGVNGTALPVYSGKITIQSSAGEQLAVPYLGMASDLTREMNPVFEDGFPKGRIGPAVGGGRQRDVAVDPTWNFDLSPGVQNFPRIEIQLKYGVRELRFDLFEAGWQESRWQYPPVVGQNGYIGSATGYIGNRDGDFDSTRDDVNNIAALPIYDLIRKVPDINPNRIWWLGKLANGTRINPGKYTMRLAALAPLGDPKLSQDWNIYKVPEITISP